MGEWLVGETVLFGLAVQNWLLIAAGVFVLYGLGAALVRMRSRATSSPR
jgi:hypothetical protein